jgi:hypothetical protein
VSPALGESRPVIFIRTVVPASRSSWVQSEISASMSTVPARSWSEIRASGTLNDPIGRPWSFRPQWMPLSLAVSPAITGSDIR